MRKEYAYILCIAGKIKKVIAKSWWNKPEEIDNIAGDMFAAAYAFKKRPPFWYMRKRIEQNGYTLAIIRLLTYISRKKSPFGRIIR